LEEIPEQQGKEFRFGTGLFPFRMFVVRREGQVWGYVNSCPHLYAPLNFRPDAFLTYDQAYILCAVHHALFEVESGLCLDGPCIGKSLTPVELEIRDGQVLIAKPSP
jgi:nitrite reductase/ring-hydroxylating ferredoxin subunit